MCKNNLHESIKKSQHFKDTYKILIFYHVQKTAYLYHKYKKSNLKFFFETPPLSIECI